ncbi:hypothetical protein HK101_010860 [Irineochytrium annulatum]|nr:hypothetical protein HK101_010860 [Irineochytrium annulatum]
MAVPHLIARDIRDIDFHGLRLQGIRRVVFDKDNTLTAPYRDELHAPFQVCRLQSGQAITSSQEAWNRCREVFKPDNIVIVSNSAGTPDDVESRQAARIEAGLGEEAQSLLKPAGVDELKKFLGIPLDYRDVLVVGDRLLTDVVYGNQGGLLTALVDPVTEEGDNWMAVRIRRAEKTLLQALTRAGIKAPPHPAWAVKEAGIAEAIRADATDATEATNGHHVNGKTGTGFDDERGLLIGGLVTARPSAPAASTSSQPQTNSGHVKISSAASTLPPIPPQPTPSTTRRTDGGIVASLAGRVGVPGAAMTVETASAQPLATTSTGTAAATASNGNPADHGPSFWSGFHKKALRERQNQLRLFFPNLFSSLEHISHTDGQLSNGHHHHQVSSPPSTSPTRIGDAALMSTDNLPSLAVKRPYTGSTASLANLDIGAAADERFPITGLDELIANNMIENCVGTMGVPVGLALNFVVNNSPVVIPMAVEEPSVVAAVSGAAKTFAAHGGFVATASERNVIFAQVVLNDVANVAEAVGILEAHKLDLISLANSFVPNMVTRGGGVVNMTVRTPARNTQPASLRKNEVRPTSKHPSQPHLVVHFHLDVCDAMGANAASTVAEGVAPSLAALVPGGARVGLRIVSNLCLERLATARFRIPVKALGYKGLDGRIVAERIIEAVEWARDDPFRAATHNKGIMNGVDAVALATGQDWRAIEASAHAWAALEEDGQTARRYGPLTSYWIERDGEGGDAPLIFCGELELPISVGTKGGVLKTNPVYNYTLGMMGFPDSKQLAMGMVCVGLAQNFAALRALSTEGIQRGHMSLHAKNIAIAAGAPAHAINECVAYMVDMGKVNLCSAKEYLDAHELHTSLASLNAAPSPPAQLAPSTLYFEERIVEGSTSERVTLNIAFQTLGPKPVHILLTPLAPATTLTTQLFGEKGHSWITTTFDLLERMELSTGPDRPGRRNQDLAKKLKLLSTLLNIVVRRLMASHPAETRRFVELVRGSVGRDGVASRLGSKGKPLRPSPLSAPQSGASTPASVLASVSASASASPSSAPSSATPTLLQVGRPLILALWQVFELRVLQWVGHAPLASALLDAQQEVIHALIETPYPSSPRLTPTTARANTVPDSTTPSATSSDSEEGSDEADGLVLCGSSSVSIKKSQEGLAPPRDIGRVCSIMASHARRFQVRNFLLCDASTFDVNVLASPLHGAIGDGQRNGQRYHTRRRIDLLATVGADLEWEQTCAHDLSPGRLGRDLAGALVRGVSMSGALGEPGVVNGFLIWLGVKLAGDSEVGPRGGIEHIARRLVDGASGRLKDVVVAVSGGREAEGISAGEAESLLRESKMDLHAAFAAEIKEFLITMSRTAHVAALLESDPIGDVFGKDIFVKVTALYREYYGVARLYPSSLK